jgi:GTP-binding protein YchF
VVHVVRAFDDDNVQHVSDTPNPKDDIEIIKTELMLADIQTLENHLPKIQKEAKGNPKVAQKVEYLKSIQGELLSGSEPKNIDSEMLGELQLLTTKPVIYVFNVDENGLSDKPKQEELALSVAPDKAIFICAKLEEELRQLSLTEAEELLADYGVKESGLSQLARVAYDNLGLQSFLTAGPKEVRAWTVPKGATAPQAAGVIHTDFERGFIAAQVVSYPDLIAAGSETIARSAGKIRTEGKTYTVKPDDIIEFRFNV